MPRERAAAAVLCAVLAGAVCLAVLAALPRDAVWIADNGNKAIVAQRLLDSRFTALDFDYPAARFDPEGRAFPIEAPFAVLRAGRPTSVWLPFYPAIAAPFLAWLGTPGLSVPAALGVAACAGLAVLWLAPAFGVAWAVAGSLALAFATPLFFYGVTIWEHSLALALALGAWVALARPVPARFALAGALVALGCAFRSEMALLGVALAIACWLERRRFADLVALALGAAPVGAALVVFFVAAYGHPLGPHVSGTLLSEAGSQRGALGSIVAWLHTASGLLTGYGTNGVEAVALAACGAGVIAFAALRRTGRAGALLAVGLALATWAYGLLRLLSADDPLAVLTRYNGLLVQLPLAGLAAVGLFRATRTPAFAALRPSLVASVLFLALGIALGGATRFSSGIHWGPRVLLLAVPALVALAIAAAREIDLAWCFRALVAAGVLSSAVATWLLAQQMGEGERLAATLLAAPEPVVVTSHPMLPQQLAPLWERKPMLYAKDAPTLDAVLRGLRTGGADRFLWLAPPGAPPPQWRGARCELRSQQRGRRVRYLDVDVFACTVSGATGSRSQDHSS